MPEPITQTPSKRYLGDGVYAQIENGMVKLTAENDIEATNTIYLEQAVIDELIRYLERDDLT